MDKKAFSMVRQFICRKPWVILGMIVLMLALTFGEKALSDVLNAVQLEGADIGIAVIRMLLQTGVSSVLIYSFHKQRIESVSLTAVDVVKLFFTGVLVSLAEVCCFVLGLFVPLMLWRFLEAGVVRVLLSIAFFLFVPLGIWLFLRLDFSMNVYITGKDPHMFSCIRTSMRVSKGYVRRYLVYNIKYLLFYFLIECVLMGFGFVQQAKPLAESFITWIDVIDAVFLSVFMPYRFLLKCGFYEVYLQKEEKQRA